MQKHLARLQAEKEIAALDALRETFADLAPAVLKAALEEVAWEAPDAIDLLRAFQIDRAPELMVIKEVGNDGYPAGLLPEGVLSARYPDGCSWYVGTCCCT